MHNGYQILISIGGRNPPFFYEEYYLSTIKFKITKYILFGYNKNKEQGGLNDILFQSDNYSEVINFTKIIKKDFFQILNTVNEEIEIIENNTEVANPINYDPTSIIPGNSVWIVSERLPVGTVIAVDDDIIEVNIGNEIVKVKRDLCFKNV